MTLNTFLTAIADSIREKKQTTDKIKAIDFPTEISTIQGGTGASSLKLYAPAISLDNVQGVLTIADTANGAFVDEYDLYANDVFVASVTSKTINLLNYLVHTETLDLKVIAKGEAFENSDFSNVETWSKINYNGTAGLSYSISTDGTYYVCLGIGEAIETNIEIATLYEGLPVTFITDKAFQNCSNLTSVIIPSSVTHIGEKVFENCSMLSSVVIQGTLEYYGVNMLMFYKCKKLKRVDLSNHTAIPMLPSINAFMETPADLQIKVPANLIDEWKLAENWSTYADKIVTEFTNTL